MAASNVDQEELVMNPITGKLDVVVKFNPNRLVTHSKNQSGNPIVVFDPVTNAYQPLDFVVVTDNDGNVVNT